MRHTATLIVAILVLGLGTGCAANIGKQGVAWSIGEASIEGEKSTVSSQGFSEGFVGFAAKTVELLVGVAKFFIPAGFQQPQAAAAPAVVPPHTHPAEAVVSAMRLPRVTDTPAIVPDPWFGPDGPYTFELAPN